MKRQTLMKVAVWAPLIIGMISLSTPAVAGTEFDIVNPENGTKLGSLTLPSDSGSSQEGIELDFGGFNESHITSVEWGLSPDFFLDLRAFRGDDPCFNAQQHGPCSNEQLTLTASFANGQGRSCPPPPQPGLQVGCLAFASQALIEFQPTAPAHACVGFKKPLKKKARVWINRNRVLPLRAKLIDSEGMELDDTNLQASPVVQIEFDSGISGPTDDITDDALPAEIGMDGNQFVYRGRKWKFNLKVKNLTAPGTYIVSLESGNEAEYRVDPNCSIKFVIKESSTPY